MEIKDKKQNMSAKNKDAMIWMRNRSWYRINEEFDRFELTDEATEEARRSFEKYKTINHLHY